MILPSGNASKLFGLSGSLMEDNWCVWELPNWDLERINETRQKLRSLWSSIETFRHNRAYCRGRSFRNGCLYLKHHSQLLLDREFDDRLAPDGELDRILHEAETSFQHLDSPGSIRWQLLYERKLSALEYLLKKEKQAVESQLRQLRSVEDALDEEDRQRNEEYDIYMGSFEKSIRDVAIRLRVVLEYLLVLCKSSKFPDGDEPICTTMPWNILPALVVLWGVCWMFYSPYGHVDPTESQPARWDGNTGFSSADWDQWLNNEQLWNTGFNLDMLAGQPPLPDSNGVSAFAAFPEHQLVDAEAFAQTEYQHVPDVRAEHRFQDVTGHPLIFTPERTRTVLSHPDPIASQSLHSPTAQATLPQSTSRPEQAQPLARNLDGYIICEHTGCSGLIFNQASDWKKHDDRLHNRYNCVFPGCAKSFGTKGVLFRHKQTKHNQLPLHKLLRCPIPGCKSESKRKDGLTSHLKNKHKYNHADAKARADAQARLQARSALDYQAEPQPASASASQHVAAITPAPVGISPADVETTTRQDLPLDRTDTVVAGPSKRRRVGGSSSDLVEDPTAASDEDLHEQLEMWKRKAVKHEGEMEAMQAQGSILREENESLRSEIDRLKRLQESLMAALVTATQKS